MRISKTVALASVVVFASAISVQAATMHKPVHATKHRSHAPMSANSKAGAAPNADRSADALNAQSLSRAQGGQ